MLREISAATIILLISLTFVTTTDIVQNVPLVDNLVGDQRAWITLCVNPTLLTATVTGTKTTP